MRRLSLHMVKELAREDERICFIGSDLGFGVMEDFPDLSRLFREGISEQHIIGMAAGLAADGKIVYLNTIASFLVRRCLEQIYLDLCLSKAKVRLIASGGGLVYAPLGLTHLAPDDFSLLRAMPNMTILAPCDAEEMRRLMPLTLELDGPVYIRLAKGGDTVVSTNFSHPSYVVGKSVFFRHGGDALFITTGIAAQIALDAASLLERDGIQAAVLHCHTLNPLDQEAIAQAAEHTKTVITVEEHVRVGGLGTAVAEIFMDKGITSSLIRAALPVHFFTEHGSQAHILEKYGLSGPALAQMVKDACS